MESLLLPIYSSEFDVVGVLSEKACQFEVEVNKCVVLALYQANPKQGWLSLSVRFANETRQHEAVKFDEAAYTDVRKRSALVDEPKDFEGIIVFLMKLSGTKSPQNLQFVTCFYQNYTIP